MKQTEQYELNQWELTDRIRMEDFNADNLKIATALAGKLGRAETIHTSISDSPSGNFSSNPLVDNWSDWELYGFLVQAEINPAEVNNHLRLRFSYRSNVSYAQADVATLKPASFFILLFPWHDENRMVEGLVIGSETKVFQMSFPFKTLSSIDCSPTSSSSTIFQKYSARRFGIH